MLARWRWHVIIPGIDAGPLSTTSAGSGNNVILNNDNNSSPGRDHGIYIYSME